MKRITLFALSLLLALTLAACRRPLGQTPYQSVDPADPPTFTEEDTDSHDELGDSADSSAEQQTPGGSESDAPVKDDTQSSTTGGQGHTPDNGDQDDRDDRNDQDDADDKNDGDDTNNSRPAGSTTTGSGKTTTGGSRTTTKGQPGKTTTRRPGTTTHRPSGDDNEADLDWGDETTKKSSPTTKKTTSTIKKPTTTVKPGTQVLPKVGDSVHEFLELTKVTVDLKSGTGTMVVKNVSRGYETEQGRSHLVYTCYDKNGKSLGDVEINIGRINAGEDSDEIVFTVPNNTYSMVFKESNVEIWTDGFH